MRIPGPLNTRFNLGESEEYIRLSYVGSEETIKEGLKRMKSAIESGPSAK